jgi:hypothetical protein
MSNVVPFSIRNGAEPSGSNTRGQSIEELRIAAWSNYYGAERHDGVSIELARQRADQHVLHFDRLVENLRGIMERG